MKRWTTREDAVVRRHYRQLPAATIGERLGRGKDEVIGRARRLGLAKSSVPAPTQLWDEGQGHDNAA